VRSVRPRSSFAKSPTSNVLAPGTENEGEGSGSLAPSAARGARETRRALRAHTGRAGRARATHALDASEALDMALHVQRKWRDNPRRRWKTQNS
jgi:hypothetical protein